MSERAEHREVSELLPWFVNGTLSESERSRVEAHVRGCMACYAALQQERRVHALVARQPSGRISSAEHGFERLVARLDERRGRAQWMRPGAKMLAVAASIAALGAVGLVWTQAVRDDGPGRAAFETLAEPGNADSRRLDIVLSGSLSQAAFRELLRSNNATIVDGPTDIGRYTIELEAAASAAEIDNVIDRLRSDPRVRFVGRSFIEEDPR